MSKLDYSQLRNSKEQLFKSHTRKESFYLQKGNGRAGSYLGTYTGDYSVFHATRRQFSKELTEKACQSYQERTLSIEEKDYDKINKSDLCDRTEETLDR